MIGVFFKYDRCHVFLFVKKMQIFLIMAGFQSFRLITNYSTTQYHKTRYFSYKSWRVNSLSIFGCRQNDVDFQFHSIVCVCLFLPGETPFTRYFKFKEEAACIQFILVFGKGQWPINVLYKIHTQRLRCTYVCHCANAAVVLATTTIVIHGLQGDVLGVYTKSFLF